jgi:hypothetical protein
LVGLAIGVGLGAFSTGWMHAPSAPDVRHLSPPSDQRMSTADTRPSDDDVPVFTDRRVLLHNVL